MKQAAAVKCVPMLRSQEFRAIEPHLGFAATGLINFAQEHENPIKYRRYKCGIVITRDSKQIAEEWTNEVGVSDDAEKIQGWISITAKPVVDGMSASENDLSLALGVNDAVVKAKVVRLRGSIESHESLPTVARYDGVGITIWKCRCRATEPTTYGVLKASEIVVTVKIVCSVENNDNNCSHPIQQ
jgi:hypothetical protein